MERRSPRAISLLAWFSVSVVVFVSSADLGVTRPGAGAGSPSPAMAGPTAIAVVGPAAIPASSPWDAVLVPPTPATGTPAGTSPAADSTSDPTTTPTSAPTSSQTPKPTAKPTAKPTTNPTTAPGSTPTPNPTANPNPTTAPTPGPTVNPAACTVFPSSNVWNRRVDDLPVRTDSATLISTIGLNSVLHPDFSSTAWNGGKGYGIPINKVNLSTPRYTVTFDYDDESDAGPYPIPANPKIEGGSDAHLLAWDTEGCYLYEIFAASKSGGKWYGGSGAIWDLRSNALRPNGWTSADAAGLPILPGLVRWDEVSDGVIRHALRFTAPDTRSSHIHPARHDAGDGNSASLPPMGLRVRLKASVDISGFGPQARVILLALKRYGMLLADNGSPWYVTGAPDSHWNDDDLHELQQLHGSDFEAVDTSDFR